MTFDLYPYQKEGAAFLRDRPRAILGDEPGLGKTRQALAAARDVAARRVNVLCPAIVRPVWREEWTRLGYNDVFDLQVESYQSLVTRGTLPLAPADVLILDECHYLKSPASQRTKLILGRTGIAHEYPVVWGLSGTPMPRNPLDLWPLLYALFPRRLVDFGIRNQRAFLERYCAYRITEYGPRIFAVKRADELKDLLQPLLLRRTVEQVLPQLPPLRWEILPLRTEDARDLARVDEAAEQLTVEQRMAIYMGDLPPADGSMATARRLLGEAKAPVAAGFLAGEASDGLKPQVVVAYHRNVLDMLERGFELVGLSVVRVHGDSPEVTRAEHIATFQRGDADIFLGQITAAGTGVTLTRATVLTIVEPDWAAHTNLQVGKRIHRIGQAHPCRVRFLTLAGTLDEPIMRSHHREVQMVKEVLGT